MPCSRYGTCMGSGPGELRREVVQLVARTCGDAAAAVADLRRCVFRRLSASFRFVPRYTADPPHALPDRADTPRFSPGSTDRTGSGEAKAHPAAGTLSDCGGWAAFERSVRADGSREVESCPPGRRHEQPASARGPLGALGSLDWRVAVQCPAVRSFLHGLGLSSGSPAVPPGRSEPEEGC